MISLKAASAGLHPLFTALPISVARTRLRRNLFLLSLITIIRLVFPPYIAIKRGLITLFDETTDATLVGTSIYLLETLISIILAFNMMEAGFSIYHPVSPATIKSNGLAVSTPSGLRIAPIMKSSPLTRSYPSPAPQITPSSTNQKQQQSTPSRNPSTPSNLLTSPQTLLSQSTPGRNSPLNTSTSNRIFNIRPTPPHPTGLFYDENASASPSKIGRPETAQSSQSSGGGEVSGSGSGRDGGGIGDFVMVEKEDRMWAENVWKGVAGKRGNIGLK